MTKWGNVHYLLTATMSVCYPICSQAVVIVVVVRFRVVKVSHAHQLLNPSPTMSTHNMCTYWQSRTTYFNIFIGFSHMSTVQIGLVEGAASPEWGQAGWQESVVGRWLWTPQYEYCKPSTCSPVCVQTSQSQTPPSTLISSHRSIEFRLTILREAV